MTKKQWMVAAVKWPAYFVYYVLVIVLLGAIAGTIAFLLFGKLFIPDMTFVELALKGGRVGGMLAGVWSLGVSVVLCFVKAHKDRKANLEKPTDSSTQ